MSDEIKAAVTGDEAAAAVTSIQSTMESFFDTAGVDHVYSEPVEHGDTIIIPAAEVLVGMGFGSGMGYGSGTSPGEGGDGEGGGAVRGCRPFTTDRGMR